MKLDAEIWIAEGIRTNAGRPDGYASVCFAGINDGTGALPSAAVERVPESPTLPKQCWEGIELLKNQRVRLKKRIIIELPESIQDDEVIAFFAAPVLLEHTADFQADVEKTLDDAIRNGILLQMAGANGTEFIPARILQVSPVT